jgi:hypothetical protein
MRRVVLAVGAVAAAVLTAAGCGGGTEDGARGGDEGELAELREQVELHLYEPGELEGVLVAALAIAGRNAGEPLGDEAFAFAEETFLDWYQGKEGLFKEGVPAAPEAVGDYAVEGFQSLAGFIAAVPTQYDATTVRDRLHSELLEQADWRLRDLEWAYNNRSEWVAELESAGTTEGSWFGLWARLENGMGASMGYKDSDAYAQEEAALRYIGELAAGAGESSDFMARWALVVEAVALGPYTPPSLEERYEDGKFITTYTEEAVAGALANAEELGRAIEAARRYFPPLED